MKDTSSTPIINCDFDPSAITLEQAQQVILQTTKTIGETEIVSIRQALGRVLRCDIVSTMDNPPNDNSAMDGYAVRVADCEQVNQGEKTILTVVGKSFAGQPFIGHLGRGEAVRIMTGAKIPLGADAVVMQEHTEYAMNSCSVSGNGADKVILNVAVKSGQNIRRQGEDINIGQTVIRAGTRLTPAAIGVLATMGIVEVEVTREVNVAIISTGDELQSLGTALKDGNIYDSNRYVLAALLNDPRFNVIEKGVLNDEKAVIEQTFINVASYADVVITTGGVSVGEADWIKDCVKKTGELFFWKAAIKPGRPITFGKVGSALFFGLPGNPVSVMVTFAQFTCWALQKLAGQQIEQPLQLSAKLLSPLKKRAGRMEFQRGILSYDEQGELCVQSTGEQGSGILTSMMQANCLIVLSADETAKAIGDKVMVESFSAVL